MAKSHNSYFSILRHLIDQAVSGLALVMLSPLLLLIAVAVLVEDGRPILFKQVRIGREGRPFDIFKFRTMRTIKSGPAITVSGDSRITRCGAILRKFKLDELPQLWNVVRGEMRLVGPRPELPQYVDLNDATWVSVLRVLPGITDPASIAYRNEAELLAGVSNPLEFYENTVLPSKLALNLEYIEKQSFWLDLKVIMQTARCAMFPGRPVVQQVKETD